MKVIWRCPKCHEVWDHYPATEDCGSGHFDPYRGKRCYGIAEKIEDEAEMGGEG